MPRCFRLPDVHGLAERKRAVFRSNVGSQLGGRVSFFWCDIEGVVTTWSTRVRLFACVIGGPHSPRSFSCAPCVCLRSRHARARRHECPRSPNRFPAEQEADSGRGTDTVTCWRGRGAIWQRREIGPRPPTKRRCRVSRGGTVPAWCSLHRLLAATVEHDHNNDSVHSIFTRFARANSFRCS